MSAIIKGSDLTEKEKSVLFWASFIALAAAGFGFSFRVAMGVKGYWVDEPSDWTNFWCYTLAHSFDDDRLQSSR